MSDSSEDEYKRPVRAQAPQRRKWIRPKRYKIADEATLNRILNPPPKPEPEFRGKDYVTGVKNESNFIFMCNEPGCSAKFTTAIGLTLHKNKHLKREIRCTFCNMLFQTTNDLDKHISEYHPDLVINPAANPLQCQKCRKVSRDKMALWRHIRESHRDRKYPCPQCNFPFTRPENLKEHLKTQHPAKGQERPKKVVCKICQKEFNHNRALRHHIRIKHRGKFDPFLCVICNTIYACPVTYKKHMKAHIEPKYIECHICNVRFTNGNHMRRHKSSAAHKKRAAAELKPTKVNFPVPVITAVKTAVNPNLTKEDLKKLCKSTVVKIRLHRVDQHVMTKSMNKVEKLALVESEESDNDETNQYLDCIYCEKTFSTLEQVKSHEFACYMKIKSKKISICHICNKEFDKPYKLKVHSQTHKNDRPFPCSYCGSFFKTNTCKIQHEKTAHFGIPNEYFNRYIKGRTFKCNYEGCSKVFARPEGVRKHVKSYHVGVRYRCEKCPRTYSRKRSYKIHLTVDHAECPVRLECKPCKRTYKNRTNYLAHRLRERHRRKTREYEQREKKKMSGSKKKMETVDVLSEKSSANTVV